MDIIKREGKRQRAQRKLISTAMAVSSKEWDKIKNSHSDEPSIVHRDAISGAPEHIRSHLSNPTTYKTIPSNMGASKKMIHQIGDDTIMVKPYNPKIQSHSRTWIKNPIQGWSTMTSKALYDAAGIGDHSEEVYADMHNDVPITLHRFSKGFTPIGHYNGPNKTPNPLHVKQVALLDYLTGNVDRNEGNLLLSEEADTNTGFHPIKAIDHEGSFQYHAPINKVLNAQNRLNYTKSPVGSESPADYLKGPALSIAQRFGFMTNDEALANWWNDVKKNVKTTFDAQLAHITSKRIKEHVAANFDKRFDILDQWSNDYIQNNENKKELFDFDENPFSAELIQQKRAPPETFEMIRSRLPAEPYAAIMEIIRFVQSKRRSRNLLSKLEVVWKNLLSQLVPEEFIKLYEYAKQKNIYLGQQPLVFEMLMFLYEGNNLPLITDFLHALGDKGKILPFWEEQLSNKLEAQNETTHQKPDI